MSACRLDFRTFMVGSTSTKYAVETTLLKQFMRSTSTPKRGTKGQAGHVAGDVRESLDVAGIVTAAGRAGTFIEDILGLRGQRQQGADPDIIARVARQEVATVACSRLHHHDGLDAVIGKPALQQEARVAGTFFEQPSSPRPTTSPPSIAISTMRGSQPTGHRTRSKPFGSVDAGTPTFAGPSTLPTQRCRQSDHRCDGFTLS